MKKAIRNIIILSSSIVGALALSVAGILIYTADYCHADEYATSCLESSESVTVKNEGKYHSFNPINPTGKGFIFYPGGKVEDIAYAPLLRGLAEKGITSYLLNMPLNLAFLDVNAANYVLCDHPELQYSIGGHSLGGVAASTYLSRDLDKFENLIMEASYSTKDLSKANIKTLSLTASNDNVLKWEQYNKNKPNLPHLTEYQIEGGIHSYFGSYGHQKGDGEASISCKKQTEIAVEQISSFILGGQG